MNDCDLCKNTGRIKIGLVAYNCPICLEKENDELKVRINNFEVEIAKLPRTVASRVTKKLIKGK